MWDVKSIEEAVEWVKKAPYASDTEVEIRPLYSLEDFAAWDEGR